MQIIVQRGFDNRNIILITKHAVLQDNVEHILIKFSFAQVICSLGSMCNYALGKLLRHGCFAFYNKKKKTSSTFQAYKARVRNTKVTYCFAFRFAVSFIALTKRGVPSQERRRGKKRPADLFRSDFHNGKGQAKHRAAK